MMRKYRATPWQVFKSEVRYFFHYDIADAIAGILMVFGVFALFPIIFALLSGM